MVNPKAKAFISPYKSLGQHFLIDQNIIRKIITACQLNKDDIILEIGPGLGALTFELSRQTRQVIAVEKDTRLYKKLKEEKLKNLKIANEDILKFDFTAAAKKVKVIGNLPYNISSPIIERLIFNRRNITSIF